MGELKLKDKISFVIFLISIFGIVFAAGFLLDKEVRIVEVPLNETKYHCIYTGDDFTISFFTNSKWSEECKLTKPTIEKLLVIKPK